MMNLTPHLQPAPSDYPALDSQRSCQQSIGDKVTVTTASGRTASSIKAKPQYIPRPCNSFILFRIDYAQSQGYEGKNPQIISKEAAAFWKSIPDEEKQPYIDRASEETEAHKKSYPHYKYDPKPKLKTKRENDFSSNVGCLASSVSGNVEKTKSTNIDENRAQPSCAIATPKVLTVDKVEVTSGQHKKRKNLTTYKEEQTNGKMKRERHNFHERLRRCKMKEKRQRLAELLGLKKEVSLVKILDTCIQRISEGAVEINSRSRRKSRKRPATDSSNTALPSRKMKKKQSSTIDENNAVSDSNNKQQILGFSECYSWPSFPGMSDMTDQFKIDPDIRELFPNL